uniref:Uncharacterized protein n=1 Tax=Anguilla anguilla TaxID=7936 RepID=A0A0E9PXW1_ANGAN
MFVASLPVKLMTNKHSSTSHLVLITHVLLKEVEKVTVDTCSDRCHGDRVY